MKIIDVYSGVGGFSLGAARAGFDLQLAIDNDPLAIASHLTNFPHCKHLEKDLSDISYDGFSALFDGLDGIDGVIGGPPCQGFSFMGKRSVDDPRNGLFRSFFEIVDFLAPKFFIAENVPGVLSEQYAPLLASSFNLVNSKYDFFDPFIVKANDFGAATTRKRVFFVGIRKGILSGFNAKGLRFDGMTENIYVKDALDGLPECLDPQGHQMGEGWLNVSSPSNHWVREKLMNGIPNKVGNKNAIQALKLDGLASGFLSTEHSSEVQDRFRALAPGQVDPISRMKRLDLNGWCPTIRAGTNSDKGSYQSVRPIHPTRARVITTREAARLQGFPDWFQFHTTKWHSFRQIGNSVSPIVAESVLRGVRSIMN